MYRYSWRMTWHRLRRESVARERTRSRSSQTVHPPQHKRQDRRAPGILRPSATVRGLAFSEYGTTRRNTSGWIGVRRARWKNGRGEESRRIDLVIAAGAAASKQTSCLLFTRSEEAKKDSETGPGVKDPRPEPQLRASRHLSVELDLRRFSAHFISRATVGISSYKGRGRGREGLDGVLYWKPSREGFLEVGCRAFSRAVISRFRSTSLSESDTPIGCCGG